MAARGKSTASSGVKQAPDAFTQAVERALELYADPLALAAESPLAAPYFLGEHISDDTPAGRGKALRELMQSTCAMLEPDQQRLLEVAFLKRDPRLNNTGVVRALNLSEATYYRHRSAAIKALASAFNQRVVPPLRSERPAARLIIDRHEPFQHIHNALTARHSVALTGPSGIGKTALAAKISDAWGGARTFWFTVRPGLNAHFDSVIFALANFMRGCGVSNLWRQLVADAGRKSGPSVRQQLLSLLRNDLAELSGSALLCVDEADLLREDSGEGAQLLHTLEEVQSLAPLLTIGQRAAIDAQHHLTLGGLNEDDINSWLDQNGVRASQAERKQLYALTRGNPALVCFLIALHHAGERWPDAFAAIDRSPAIDALITKLWRRLSAEERQLLATLAVHDGPAPLDAYAHQSGPLETLKHFELAVSDARGGIAVPERVRRVALAQITPEMQADLHLTAARTREERGEYTAAARHYLAAGEPEMAIWVWYANRELETERGNAPAARELFRHLHAGDLASDEDRRVLTLLRTEQLLIIGDADGAEREIDRVAWPAGGVSQALADELRADALQARGAIDSALRQYRRALETAGAAQQRQIARIHTKMGYVYVYRARDLDLAQREARIALCQAHNFMGLVHEEAGRYADALREYERALAEATPGPESAAATAITHSHLGHLHMRRGDAARAISHLTLALKHAEHAGQPLNALYDRLNLASALLVGGDPAAALKHAGAALPLAESINNAFLIAGLHATAAEAHFMLDDLDAAEQSAQLSLRAEEDVHRSFALSVLGRIQCRRGARDAGLAYLNEAIASAQQIDDRYAEGHAWQALADATNDADARARAASIFGELSVGGPT